MTKASRLHVGWLLQRMTNTNQLPPSARLLKFFGYQHLPGYLQEISKPIFELATAMFELLPESAEKTAGMRKLLEAKDCFVRAKLESVETEKEKP